MQYHNGTDWVDAPGQSKSPAAPRANYNKVTFGAVTARRMRVLLTRTGTLGIGVKELQLFDTGSQVQVPGGVGGTVPPTLSLSLGAPASFGAFIPGVAREYSASTTANVVSTAGDALFSVGDPSSNATGRLVNGSFSLVAGTAGPRAQRRANRYGVRPNRQFHWHCSATPRRSATTR